MNTTVHIQSLENRFRHCVFCHQKVTQRVIFATKIIITSLAPLLKILAYSDYFLTRYIRSKVSSLAIVSSNIAAVFQLYVRTTKALRVETSRKC
jgi:hypothetical protein